MPRPKQLLLTEEEKFKQQVQQEQELARFQRQYTLLEQDRHRFTGGGKLQQLNHILNIFRREHANILTDLAVATSSTKRKLDAKVVERLATYLEEYDYYTENVDKERQYRSEMDIEIKLVEKNVAKLRSQQITDRQFEDRVWLAMKTVEGLENKLEVQMIKFGQICAELGQMKLQIHDLLCSRELFLKIWRKMIHKLEMGKRFLLDLIEQATIAYDQREEWCSKLQALRLKAHQDYVIHIQQMTELERRADNNVKLEEFFSVKGQKRVMRDLERREMERRLATKEKLDEKKEQYQQLMDEILEFTRQPEVNVIATKYRNQEAENFSRFIYINDLLAEMEVFGDNLGVLHLEIEQKRAVHDVREQQQRSRIEDLERQLEEAKAEYAVSEKEMEDHEDYLTKVLEGIERLFNICKCVRDPILDLLGDNAVINKYNAALYLELIEKKIQYAMLAVYHKNKLLYDKKKITSLTRVIDEAKTKSVVHPLDRIVTSSPCPLCMETEMVSDVIDTLQRVVSRKKAVKSIAARLSSDAPSDDKLHNVSACHLPKSREIMQKRYQ